MKKLVYIFAIIATILPFSLHCQDSIFTNGTNKVTFNLKKKVSFHYISCVRRTTSATTTITPTTISGIGKVLFKSDGTGTLQPSKSDYLDRWIIYETLECGLKEAVVYVGPRIINIPTNPLPTTPSYNWTGNVYNSSGLHYGAKKFKGLRSIRCVAEFNGFLYMSVGYPEGKSPVIKSPINNPKERNEVMPPPANGFVMEVTAFAETDNYLFWAGYDPFATDDDGGYSSNLDCMVIAIDKSDNEVIFSSGVSTRCTYQDKSNPYKSVIGIYKSNPNKRPTKIEVVNGTINLYHTDKTLSKYDLNGKFLSTSTFTPQISFTRGASSVVMANDVTYNGKVICKGQSSALVDNYTFFSEDYNTHENIGSVYIDKSNRIYVCDNGNCRVLVYDSNGVYLYDIHYLPMTYSCSVDRNDPSRVTAGFLEFKYDYKNKSYTLVKNWAYGLPKEFKPYNQGKNLLRNLVTVNGVTYCTINKFLGGYEYPTLFKLTTKAELVKEYPVNANLHIDTKGVVWRLSLDYSDALKDFQYTLFKNEVVHSQFKPDNTTAFATDKAVTFSMMGDTLVAFQPHKSHQGYHLTFVVSGKFIYNGMPSKAVGESRVYPDGDFFATSEIMQYAGADNVWTCKGKVFVKYIGEFFGGAGGQTNLFFVYDQTGKLLFRGGKTNWNTIAGEEAAGNANGGGVVFVNGKYYFWNNCEHSGALQYFEISGI